MSQWIEKFNQHPIHATLTTLESLLDEVNVDDFKDVVVAIGDFERIKQVLNLTKQRLKSCDPNLVPLQQLKNLNTSFQTVTNEVTAFKTNKNTAHLTNANSHIENILLYVNDIYLPIHTSDLEGLRDAVTSYRRSAGQYIRNIEDESASAKAELLKLKAEIDKLSSDVTAQKQRLDSIINNSQQQFSAAEEQRRASFNAVEDEVKAKSSELLEKKKEEWDEIIKEKNVSYNKLIEAADDSIESLKIEITSEAKEIIGIIVENKKTAEKLVGIITATGMVGGYQRVANEEQKAAKNWQWIAASSLFALALFAIYAFATTLGSEFKWSAFGARIFVATALGILAAYAALQADKHRISERKNRKIELELASISPYLHDLPIEQQHKIKEELAMRLFGKVESMEEKIDKKTTGSVIDLLRMALESIESLSKK